MSQKRPNEKTDPNKYRKDLTAVTMNDMHDYRSSNQNRLRESQTTKPAAQNATNLQPRYDSRNNVSSH
jgi:hypothetical protein